MDTWGKAMEYLHGRTWCYLGQQHGQWLVRTYKALRVAQC